MTLKIQVFKWRKSSVSPGAITVITDCGDGGGTRIAGPPMLSGDATLVAEFVLGATDIEMLSRDLAQATKAFARSREPQP